MKPQHRRSWIENEEFGRFKRWYRSRREERRRIKRYGHHVDRAIDKKVVADEVRWAGDESGWTE